MVRVAVLVADPHELVRMGVCKTLASDETIEIVGEASDGRSALIKCEAYRPTLLITELVLANVSGPQVIEQVTAQQRMVRVLVHTARDDEGSVRSAFAAGATGYVLKQSGTDSLLQGVHALLRGDSYVDPQLPTAFRLPQSHLRRCGDLSPREQQVLALVAMGYSNKEIAQRACVSVKTVETYRARAAEKLGLCSRADFVRYAVDQGLLKDLMLGA